MSTNTNRPRVGVGVIIENAEGKILVGKRKGKHAPFYSIPGGSLEMGETFEDAALREVKEETNLSILDLRVIAVTNNLETYNKEGLHYISIILHTKTFSGELHSMEPERYDGLQWCDPRKLPQPHFDASRLGVDCFLQGKFFVGISEI